MDTVAYPTVQVTLNIDGWAKELSAAVVPKLPVDFLIVWKDYTSDISGVASLAMMTISQKRRQTEPTPGCVCGDTVVAKASEGSGPATRVTRWHVRQYLCRHPDPNSTQAEKMQADKQSETEDTDNDVRLPLPTNAHTPIGDLFQASPQQLREWRQTDPTLSKSGS